MEEEGLLKSASKSMKKACNTWRLHRFCIVVVIFAFFVTVLAMLQKLHCITNNQWHPHFQGNDVLEVPLIVTSGHNGNFLQSIDMLDSFFANFSYKFSNVVMVYYDVGLTDEQRENIMGLCSGTDCAIELRIFNFARYPKHVEDLALNAYIPLIINELIMEWDYLMWISPAVRFYEKSNIETVFKRSTSYEIQTVADSSYIMKHISKNGVQLFVGEPIYYKYAPMIRTDFIVLSKTNHLFKYLLLPWVDCAKKSRCLQILHNDSPCLNKTRAECRPNDGVLSLLLYKYYEACTYSYTIETDLFGSIHACQDDHQINKAFKMS